MLEQTQALGAEHIILSSDFGQPANGNVVSGFARGLRRLLELGLSEKELALVVKVNPKRLLEGK